MRSRFFARLALLCLLASGAYALESDSAVEIQYPLEGYLVAENDPDEAIRAKQVRSLEKRLEEEFELELAEVELGSGGPPIATGLRLNRVVPPIRVLLNDPLFLFRSPVILEWLELVDERGQVTRVWVTASNQSKHNDQRIIGWCTSVTFRGRGELDRASERMLRSAGISLVTSPYHYSYWTRKLSTPAGMILGLLFAAVVAWLVNRVLSFRRRQQMRHDQLMSRLRRTTTYKPPSIDDGRG